MRTVCSNGCGTENNYHIISVDSGSVVLEAQIPMGALRNIYQNLLKPSTTASIGFSAIHWVVSWTK